VVESAIFEIADPDLPIYTTLFHHKYDMVVEKQAKTIYGATMMIKGSLLLSAPIVKYFRSNCRLIKENKV